MSYRCALLALVLLAGLLRETQAADLSPVNGGGVTGLDLKSQLEKGLYARRPVEFEYIEQIIQLVEDGDLPRDLVTSTFVWARKKPNRKLQYFQFALQSRARGLDVDLPNLRLQAVGISGNGGQHGVNNPSMAGTFGGQHGVNTPPKASSFGK